MRRALAVLALCGAAIGCSVLLDFDKLRDGRDQGVVVEDLAGADLTGVDQAGADLAGVDLAGVDLANGSCLPAPGGPFFDPPDEHPTPSQPHSLTVYDVDGDGKLDLVIGTDSNNLYVLKNLGARQFSGGTSYPSGCNMGTHHTLLLGDFDGDGKLDAVDGCDDYYNGGSVSELAFLPGTGGGAFGAPVMFTNKLANPEFGMVADLDHDGRPDAIVGDKGGNGIAIYWGATSGFATQAPLKIHTGFDPWGVDAASLGGDGVLDLVVANAGGDVGDMAVANGGVTVLRRGRTAGSERTFTAPMADQLSTGTTEPLGIAFARLDTDAHPELVLIAVGTNLLLGAGVAMGAGTSYASLAPGPNAFKSPRGLATGDLDCDGIDDAVVTHFQAIADPTDYDRYEIYRGGGTSLAQVQAHDVGASGAPATDRVRIADLDGDGHPDVVMTLFTTTTGAYRILWGRGTAP